MAIVWSYATEADYYQVRTAGASVRLYRNGVHHSQWNPKRPLSGSVWDLLALPALYRKLGTVRTVCVLGFGAGAVAGVLQAVASPDSITGVELDPMHLSIADGFFDCVEGCELVAGDAVEWVQEQDGVSGYDLIIDDLLDLIGGVGGIVGGEIVLLSVIFCSDEKGFEGSPLFYSGWSFPPSFAILVEQTGGLYVVVGPPHEL